MPSIISAGTTTGTALSLTSDTSGELQIRTNNGSTTAMTLTTGGNLNIPTTGARITGDFSNATVANRVAFQTSTTNGNTVLNLIPNGTGTVCAFGMDTDPALTNSSTGSLNLVATTDVRLNAGIRGSGTYLPITMYTGGSERLRIDTSGNVGIGTSSPSTFSSLARNLVVNAATSAGITISESTGAGTASLLFAATSGFPNTASITRDYVSNSLQFGFNATERMRFPAAGGVLTVTCVSVGNATPAASGAGITFPATQSASSDANTLDDYEEGGWTPTVFLGATQQTVLTATANYTKIGNVVFIAGRAESVTKSGTGNLEIRNLPFSITNAGNLNKYCQVTMRWAGINSSGVIIPIFSPGSTVISLQDFASTGYAGAINNAQISASYELYGFSGFYYTD